MKKLIFAVIVFTLMLSLAACGSTATSKTSDSSTNLSLEGQLLVGTLKLEDTTSAVTTDQASELLPLWETLQSLAVSGTAASQEIEAVVDQIKSTMSPEQVASITAMKLTQQDLATAITGIDTSSSTSSSTSTTSVTSSQPQAGGGAGALAGGDTGGGNPPADMGGGRISADASGASAGIVQASATQAATSQSTVTSNQIPTALISSLVELLQKKIG